MASGILGFLGLGKKSKPSLNQDITSPNAASAPLYGQLKDFASDRIAGIGTGFGDDFTSRMSNPAISQIDANFENRTMPKISSEASKRGIGRSTLVLDQIGQADLQRNRDIQSTVADFYKLNELTKKSDQQFGVQTGENLDTQYLNQANRQADESAKVRDLTNSRASADNLAAEKQKGQTLQSAGSLLSPILGDAYSKYFPDAQSVQNQNAQNAFLKGNGAQANVASTSSDSGGDSGGIDWGQVAATALPILLSLI